MVQDTFCQAKMFSDTEDGVIAWIVAPVNDQSGQGGRVSLEL